MSTASLRAAGVACYLVGVAGAVVFPLFVLLLGMDLWPFPPLWRFSSPWPANLAWLLVFALQHSVMVRDGFKRWWTRIVPARLERSIYAGLSGLLLLLLPAVWQPIPGDAWWRLPLAFVVVPLAVGVAQTLMNTGFDHATLFGLRQAWSADPPAAERLFLGGPYRFVRHPLYACTLLFLWTQPVMTPTLALLVVGLSVYIGIGLLLEERDLLRRFGPVYAAYRRRVPCLIPWRRPASPEEFEVQA